MQRVFLVSGVVLAVAVLYFSRSSPAPVDAPSPTTLAKLAKDTGSARRERLREIAAKLQQGPQQPQAMLVQVVEGGKSIVVETAADEVSDDEAATGWEIPWTSAADALKQEPSGSVSAHGVYSGIRYSHLIIPISRDEGVYLLVNSGAPPRGWSGWPAAGMIAAVVFLVLGLRPTDG